MPKNQFEHATELISEDQEELRRFTQLVNKQAMLANISDDKTLRLYQDGVTILVHAFELSMRDPKFRPVFQTMFYDWEGELKMTRAKDDSERKHQAAVGSGYTADDYSGYGQEWLTKEQEDARKQQGGGNVIQKVVGGLKKMGKKTQG